MAENECTQPSEETVTLVKNGDEIVMDKQTYEEGVSSGKLKVTEGSDGKKHLLERMNG